jgi:hypothetical protein
MLKYLAIFAVLLGLAIYVSAKDKQTAQDAAQKAAHQNSTVLSAKSNEDHAQEDIEDAERNLPSWYGFFRWPYGTTAWAIILTLFAIAEQTKHTAEAAEATRESVGAITQQTSLLKDSVAAAKSSADAAIAQIELMKNRERARLSVFMSEDEFEVGVDDFDGITIGISNDGLTSALNVNGTGEAFGEPGENLPYMAIQQTLNLPNVFRANEEPTAAEMTVFCQHDLREFTGELPYYFHVSGLIQYQDVFGESHKTTFRYRLKVLAVRTSPDSKRVKIRTLLGWRKCGPPEDNHAT